MSTWYAATPQAEADRTMAAWQEMPLENLELCALVLDTAREQVAAYARKADLPTPPSTAIPARLVYAQLQQARNLWNAGRAGGDGDLGADGFTFTPRPLDKTIRDIIRPKDVAPYVL